MAPALSELIRGYKSLSIIGMCKNAGKTTAMNRLIRELTGNGQTIALTSIGRDGESSDLVTGTKKPGIWVAEGTMVATASDLLRFCDFTKEILDTTGVSTPMGEVVILKARSDGNVQIAGPSITDQLARLSQQFVRLGADMTIIDGAISRKTLCSRKVTEATILCTGASYNKNIEVVLRDTQHTCRLLTLPEVEDQAVWQAVEANAKNPRAIILIGPEHANALTLGVSIEDGLRKPENKDARYIFLGGAMSDGQMRPLLMSNAPLKGKTFVVRDSSKLLISADTYEKIMIRGAKIQVLESVNLVAVTINPFSAYGYNLDKDELMQRMQALVDVPVINVEEA